MYIAPMHTINIHVHSTYIHNQYIHINTWAFPYWPGCHPKTPILAQDGVEDQYRSRNDNQANMEMPMY